MTYARARAQTFGAISIVNAIACGKGATASVRLTTEAEVEVEDSPGTWEVKVNGRRSESRLAVETVRSAMKIAGKDPAPTAER